ncbi:BadF-type ATPase [Glycomyces sambucus]|uniref:BadF-type ATPase n=1 Tax=Glycomyces sambucus TaxID=380244 RepID=A0A1G9HWG0_9ACTN|nr:BadF/BadG/BcrA/BcrD ATPase family protein [Glycomyces sambucus]SDL17308.1 BadF-type ATPase [Glycomyces sambucus]
MSKLVLGLDVGGTSSRAIVITLDGETVGRGDAGGGNPLAVPPDLAAAEVARALHGALAGTDPTRVAAAVLGLAGVSGFDQPDTAAAFQRAWDAAGLRCPVRAVGDAQVAFASGTDEPLGTVLIAGTGSAAARIDGDRITRVGDGLGWLLGDRGSGFWIGRKAAADTALRLQAGLPPTPLTGLVVRAILAADRTDGPDTSDAFVIAVHRRPPRSLDRLAPLVTEAALAGDAGAAAILDEAAAHLATAVAAVRDPAEATPIVLSGSVLRGSAPVREGVRARLAAAWPDAPVTEAGPAELGAAKLAAQSLRSP